MRRSRRDKCRAVEAGDGAQIHTKTMKDSNLSLASRKQLADLLNDRYDGIRSRAKQRYRIRRDNLHDSLIKQLAEKKGAYAIYEKIVDAQDEVKKLKASLGGLGFTISHANDISLNDNGTFLHGETIDARIEKEIGTQDDIDARFESTQLALMTVATLEDAEKLLKAVSEI